MLKALSSQISFKLSKKMLLRLDDLSLLRDPKDEIHTLIVPEGWLGVTEEHSDALAFICNRYRVREIHVSTQFLYSMNPAKWIKLAGDMNEIPFVQSVKTLVFEPNSATKHFTPHGIFSRFAIERVVFIEAIPITQRLMNTRTNLLYYAYFQVNYYLHEVEFIYGEEIIHYPLLHPHHFNQILMRNKKIKAVITLLGIAKFRNDRKYLNKDIFQMIAGFVWSAEYRRK